MKSTTTRIIPTRSHCSSRCRAWTGRAKGNSIQAILLEASLSYLGLGVQEPTPAWGLMLQGGAEEYALSAPWMAIFPGVAISLAVFGFNLFGDAVRDVLDPRLRSR